MKFSIGDPVYIKSNDEEGVIEEFIGKDMASVLVNKKNYHVFLEDLDHPYLRWFLQQPKTAKKQATYIDQLHVEKSKGRKSVLPEGIYLVCMPVYKMDGFDEVIEKLKLYLYNETSKSYSFEYLSNVKNEIIFSMDSELLSNSEFYLHDIGFDLMANHPSFRYRFIDKKNPAYDNEGILSIKPKKLFEKIDEIKYANNAFFHFLLFEEIKVREKKEVIIPGTYEKRASNAKIVHSHFNFEESLKKSAYEVDLHIEKLVPDYKGLSPSAILQIQITECEKSLDLAMATHQPSLIIIHGIGKGVLKNEINSLLNQTKGIKKYVNEYDVRYGYGATKVFFRY